MQRTLTKRITFRINVKSLVGKPNIAIKKYKIAVFIDSCFWHCCPVHVRVPLSNLIYWIPKLKENMARDKKVTKFYLDHGWKLLRIWEHRVRREFEIVVCEISALIKEAKDSNNRRK